MWKLTNPNINGENVQVLPEKTVEERAADCALRQDENFQRMSKFCSL